MSDPAPPSGPSNHERRKFVRVLPRPNETISVQVRFGRGFAEILFARDISAGGMAVAIHHDVDPKTIAGEVQLMVSLPDQGGFQARGTIRHISTSKQMFGVQFTAIAEKDVAAINAYVEARVKEGGVAP